MPRFGVSMWAVPAVRSYSDALLLYERSPERAGAPERRLRKGIGERYFSGAPSVVCGLSRHSDGSVSFDYAGGPVVAWAPDRTVRIARRSGNTPRGMIARFSPARIDACGLFLTLDGCGWAYRLDGDDDRGEVVLDTSGGQVRVLRGTVPHTCPRIDRRLARAAVAESPLAEFERYYRRMWDVLRLEGMHSGRWLRIEEQLALLYSPEGPRGAWYELVMHYRYRVRDAARDRRYKTGADPVPGLIAGFLRQMRDMVVGASGAVRLERVEVAPSLSAAQRWENDTRRLTTIRHAARKVGLVGISLGPKAEGFQED